jgi:hypothetical protein
MEEAGEEEEAEETGEEFGKAHGVLTVRISKVPVR